MYIFIIWFLHRIFIFALSWIFVYPIKEAKVIMHVLLSKEEKLICHGYKQVLFTFNE